MIFLLRIAIGACSGAGVASFLWWFVVRLGNPPGIPLAVRDVPLYAVASAGALIGGVSGAVQALTDRRRARLNRELAYRLGLAFVDHVTATEIRDWSAFALLRKDSPRARDRMSGEYAGRRIDVFDFAYDVTSQSGEGSSTSTHTQTVFRFPDVLPSLPRFLLQPRNRLSNFVANMIGATEAELSLPAASSEPEFLAALDRFRRHYQVIVNENAAAALSLQGPFHAYVVAWLSDRPGWTIESSGTDIVAWKAGKLSIGEDRLAMLDRLGEFLTLVSAADLAEEQTTALTIELKSHDRVRGFAGFLGIGFGAIAGFAAGGLLGSLAISAIVPGLPDGAVPTPVVVAAFFGFPIVFGLLGGFLGYRHGRSSAWGQWLATRLDPFRGAKPVADTTPSTFRSTSPKPTVAFRGPSPREDL